MVPRIGAPIREYPLTLVRQVQHLGIPVVNRFEAILLARNKFLTLQTLQGVGVSVPDSAYASNGSNFRGAVSALGGFPLVLKRPYSRQGKGVALVHSYGEAGPVLEDLLHSGQGFLVQHYIPPEKRRDIRILVVGGKIAGAVSLSPKGGEFRANIHLRARAEILDMTEKMAELAIKSTEALGLDISGVDMIEEGDGSLRVIDVNYAPGFRGMEKCTGIDVAVEIIKYVIKIGLLPKCRSPF
jgi:ribosomal protein S6--L-glutamate ligase